METEDIVTIQGATRQAVWTLSSLEALSLVIAQSRHLAWSPALPDGQENFVSRMSEWTLHVFAS